MLLPILLCFFMKLILSRETSLGSLQVPHPEDYVNILAGASGGSTLGQHHSPGNTLPLVARPWGFNHWAPMTTDERTSWWFDASSDSFLGIRCTHQPSPWIGDYAWFLLRPYTGFEGNDWQGFTSYRASGAMKPYLIDLNLGPAGVRIELTPTNHGAFARVTFPETIAPTQRRICAYVPKGGVNDNDERRGIQTGSCAVADSGINLQTRKFSDGVRGQMALYVRLEASGLVADDNDADCVIKNQKYEPLNMPGKTRTQEAGPSACQARCVQTPGCAYFTYWPDGGCHIQDKYASPVNAPSLVAGPSRCKPKQTGSRQCCFTAGQRTQVEISIGTSFISEAQSLRALDSEVRGRSFESLVDAGRAAWRHELRRIEVLDAGPPTAATFQRLEIFYSSLYRVLLFPRRLDEEMPDGVRHWSPYSGLVAEGIGVTDNGFWDTFRTVYPLLALAYPSELGHIVTGWLNAFRDGGWLPKWASPGYRGDMVGTFADVVVADAIIKNISGINVSLAWDALRKDAYVSSGDAGMGKVGLDLYTKHGFIPVDSGVSESCSRTLDFAFADAATAAVAKRLGNDDQADTLLERSRKAVRSIYDPDSGLMGHKRTDGSFNKEPLEQWGNCFTEGSAWHHSFPPFDLADLENLHGGREKLLEKLHQLFAVRSNFQTGSYGAEIHEMREMRILGLGQYAHNNQPSHHIPYLFAMLGDQNTTTRLVREILFRAYSTEGFAGDEDNGEMGAWFVLSALGLYAPATGTSEDYVVGAVPLFPRVRLQDWDIILEAPSAAETYPVIKQVFWQSRPLSLAAVSFSELRKGGTLRFMTPGDPDLGRYISSLRGALHKAARTVQESSLVVKHVHSGIAAPEMSGNEELPTNSDNTEGKTWSSMFKAIVLIALLLSLFVFCKRKSSRDRSEASPLSQNCCTHKILVRWLSGATYYVLQLA